MKSEMVSPDSFPAENECLQEIDSYTLVKSVRKGSKLVKETTVLRSGNTQKPSSKASKAQKRKPEESDDIPSKKRKVNDEEPPTKSKLEKHREKRLKQRIRRKLKKQMKYEQNKVEVPNKQESKKVSFESEKKEKKKSSESSSSKDSSVNQNQKQTMDVKTLDINTEPWKSIFVCDEIISAIQKLNFKKPTEIQKQTIPAAICSKRDIVGAAETGSGKTLAFGIPIVQGILKDILMEAELPDDTDSDSNSGIEEEGIMEEEEYDAGESDSVLEEESLDENSYMEDYESEQSLEELESDQGSPMEEEDSDEEQNLDELESDHGSFIEEEHSSEEQNLEELDSDQGSFIEEEDSSDEQNLEKLESDQGSPLEEEDSSEEKNMEELGSDSEEQSLNEDFDNEDQDSDTEEQNLNDSDSEGKLSDDENNQGFRIRRDRVRALIVTPTRELAAQIKKHIDGLLTFTKLKSVLVIGGMYKGKQERLLKRCPEIVIGTPGRLWELIEEENEHLSDLEGLDYLAVDETDRMVEDGHFEDLHKILDIINKSQTMVRRQTFVFSATLTLKRELPRGIRFSKKAQKITAESRLNEVLGLIGIKGKPKVVDLTTTTKTASSLTEFKLFCNSDSKENYLFYFLKKYPGRTLVFCNSISCIRRLQKLFDALGCNPHSIHASKYQKQRMKSLERFSKQDSGLLLATDVAARGLDLPEVKYVIHYEVPKTYKTYIHRSGRAGRAKNKGMSLMLVQPNEHAVYCSLLKHLERVKDIPDLPIKLLELEATKDMVTLAKNIERKEFSLNKGNPDGDKIVRLAKNAGVYQKGKDNDQEESSIADRKKRKEQKALEAEKATLRKWLKKQTNFVTYNGYSSISDFLNKEQEAPQDLFKEEKAIKESTIAVKKDTIPKSRSKYSLKAAKIRNFQKFQKK